MMWGGPGITVFGPGPLLRFKEPARPLSATVTIINGRRVVRTAEPRWPWLWGKLILAVLMGIFFIFGISRCQTYTRHNQSADAQWALSNLSLAQRAYYEAHKTYAMDYERLAHFGFQEYSNIAYSDITVYDEDPQQPGWRAQVRFKSRQAVPYTYDSTKGGFLDIAK